LNDEIEKQCDNMLWQGIIRPSMSPFYVLMLLDCKKDKTWWFCVYYCALNARTVKDKFPVPIVDELLDEFKGAHFFTKLDFCSDYQKVLMHPNDITKAVFRMHYNHFKFLVMVFGLSNISYTF
jgi:hypothetical protein